MPTSLEATSRDRTGAAPASGVGGYYKGAPNPIQIIKAPTWFVFFQEWEATFRQGPCI